MSPPAHPEDVAEQRRMNDEAAWRPRVFIVQRPTQRDPSTGGVVPSMDLSPANEWGEVVFLLRDSENPFGDVDATAKEVERMLDDHGYDSEDFLLLVGNPALIGIVAAVASAYSPKMQFLQWSKADHGYRPVVVNIPN